MTYFPKILGRAFLYCFRLFSLTWYVVEELACSEDPWQSFVSDNWCHCSLGHLVSLQCGFPSFSTSQLLRTGSPRAAYECCSEWNECTVHLGTKVVFCQHMINLDLCIAEGKLQRECGHLLNKSVFRHDKLQRACPVQENFLAYVFQIIFTSTEFQYL